MTNEDILNEVMYEAHIEGIFNDVMLEVNKLRRADIKSNRLELFEKAIKNVRRDKTL